MAVDSWYGGTPGKACWFSSKHFSKTESHAESNSDELDNIVDGDIPIFTAFPTTHSLSLSTDLFYLLFLSLSFPFEKNDSNLGSSSWFVKTQFSPIQYLKRQISPSSSGNY